MGGGDYRPNIPDRDRIRGHFRRNGAPSQAPVALSVAL
jgi:hypothetical protein